MNLEIRIKTVGDRRQKLPTVLGVVSFNSIINQITRCALELPYLERK